MPKVYCDFMEFIDNWYKTAKAVIFHPKEFFKKMPTTGGYKEPLVFALINIFIGSMLTVGFKIASPDAELQQALQILGIDMLKLSWIIVPLALVLGCIGLFLFSGIAHLFLKLVGAKKNYEATFRVFAYLSIFNILASVSSINTFASNVIGFLIFLYVIYLTIIGFSEVHKITLLRAIISVALMLVSIFIVLIILAFIIGILAYMWILSVQGGLMAQAGGLYR